MMRRCPKDHKYTLQPTCPSCGEKTLTPHPPKFSVPDKLAVYRRKAKYPNPEAMP